MSIETRIQIRKYSSGEELAKVADKFARRDYDTAQEFERFPLVAGVRTGLKTTLTSIAFVYVHRTGSSATIEVSKNLSPESWGFDDCWLAIGGSVTSLSFESSADTELYLYIAGS